MIHDKHAAFGRGMTLVEILAVVVILSLVAGTLLVGFSGSFGKAKHEIAKTGMAVILTQLEKFRLETGSWPSNDIGLSALTDGHASPASSFYLSPSQLLDPWDRPYLYVTPGPDGHPFELLSYGADGQPGPGSAGDSAASGAGSTEDLDITSTNLRGSQ